MNIRVSAEDAGWTIREAVWGFEERVLWKGSDATRHALEPLQRLVQTKLTWPLGDAFRGRSRATRAAIAASAATVALAAAAAGAVTAPDHPAAQHPAPRP